MEKSNFVQLYSYYSNHWAAWEWKLLASWLFDTNLLSSFFFFVISWPRLPDSISPLHTCEIHKFIKEIKKIVEGILLLFTKKHLSKDMTIVSINLILSHFSILSYLPWVSGGSSRQFSLVTLVPNSHRRTGWRNCWGSGRIKQRKRNIAKRRENSRQVSLVRTLIATPFYPPPPPPLLSVHTHTLLPLLNFRSAEDSTISGRGRLKLR